MRKMATKSATIFAFCCASCGTFFRNGKLTFKKAARPHESWILGLKNAQGRGVHLSNWGVGQIQGAPWPGQNAQARGVRWGNGCADVSHLVGQIAVVCPTAQILRKRRFLARIDS